MTVKRFTHLALIFATLAGLIFAISAQDDDSKTRGSRFGIGSSAILEATGLDEAGLKEALQAGSTIAELVEANGGVVDSVIAELVAAASAALNTRIEAGQLTQERADSILEMLEARISARLNGSFEGLGSVLLEKGASALSTIRCHSFARRDLHAASSGRSFPFCTNRQSPRIMSLRRCLNP